MGDMLVEISGKYHMALDNLSELANALHMFTSDGEWMHEMRQKGRDALNDMKETVDRVVSDLERVGEEDFRYYLESIMSYQDKLNAGGNPVFATMATAECYQTYYGGKIERHRRFVYEVIPKGKESTVPCRICLDENREAA